MVFLSTKNKNQKQKWRLAWTKEKNSVLFKNPQNLKA